MAYDLRLAIHRHGCNVRVLHSDQRALEASDHTTERATGSLADGAALFPVQTEAGAVGAIQPVTEAGIYLDDSVWSSLGSYRRSALQTGAARFAGETVRRIRDDPDLSFCGDGRVSLVHSRPPADGGAARLEQLLLYAHWVETPP